MNATANKTSIKSTKVATKAAAKRVAAKLTLLAGGNPQIAKAVQAYIAAMPGWKSDVGRRLDALIVRTVPGVRKAVKWNSPFFGVEGRAANQPFAVATLSPPIGAPLPGAVVSFAVIGSPASMVAVTASAESRPSASFSSLVAGTSVRS